MKFKQSVKVFLKSKTNWLGLSMIIGGTIAIINSMKVSVIIPEEAVKSILAGLALVFVRDGIAGLKDDKTA